MTHTVIPWLGILLAATSLPAWATYDDAVEDRPCLDYWAVGNSKGCQKAPVKKPKPEAKPVVASPTAPPPQPVAEDPSPTLNKKIDDFIANHGKPPREFVAFYLDPTPENAMKWVAKYNELLQRGNDIAVAWTQAEKLYDDAIKGGAPASAFNPTAMPPVPDFGVPLPGINMPAFTQLISASNPVVPAAIPGLPAPAVRTGAVVPPPDVAVSSGNGLLRPEVDLKTTTSTKPLEVSYYFSSICPYCKKFEPGFASVVGELGANIRLTCVDVTPEIGGATRDPHNLGNALPCTWRPVTDEEITRLNIRQTPSLVINKGDDQALEMVSGYVEPSKLRAYFINLLASLKKM